MQSENEVSTDKTLMINDSTLSNKLSSLKQEPEINRARKWLLFLIRTLLIILFMRFIFTIYIYGKDYSIAGESSKNIIRIVSFIIAFVYYGFGFFVTHGYSRIGLLVFAWTGVLYLLTYIAIIVIALIFVIGVSNSDIDVSIIGLIITIINFLIMALLQIFTIRYAFILSKLLKNTKSLTKEQI